MNLGRWSLLGTSHAKFSFHWETNPHWSNVQQTDLETSYNWGFYHSYKRANGEARSLLPSTELFESLYFPDYYISSPLKLPDDWKVCIFLASLFIRRDILISVLQDPQGDDIQSLTRKILQVNVLSRMKDGWSRVQHEYYPREDVEAIEYPGPNVALCEMDNYHSEPSFGIEWTILKIIDSPEIHSCGSEIDVARHIGLTLAGFFNIVDCTTLSYVHAFYSEHQLNSCQKYGPHVPHGPQLFWIIPSS